ncbi:MAG: hypothetical protein B655_0873 [Methanobacterium sp. Maddingley MBC34]|nr:MAG: hypothetical protein B655_0873 [Methanobacterium sp. Maddingley MBC34]
MRKNLGLLAILAVVIVVVAVSGCSNNNSNNTTNVNAINEKSTKVALYNNNNDTWLQVELVGNVTFKNGTNATFYSDVYVKPNGNATIDLSQLLGYGNEKLPANTTIRFQSWKGLFNTTNVGSQGNVNLTFQGWSNTLKPGADDKTTNVTYNPLTIYLLDSKINDTTIFVAFSPEELAKITPYDTAEQEPLYEEELIFVDENGKVTITVTRAPELCRAISSIV